MGLAVWFLIQGSSSIEIGIVLAAGAVWNLVLTYLAIKETPIGGSIRIHRLSTTALDLILANLFFFFSLTQAQTLWWVGILPIITGSLYYPGRGLIVVILICLASLGTLTFLSFPLPVARLTISLMAITLIGLGLLFYFISSRLQASLKTAERLQAKTSQENARIENEQKRFLYNLVASLSATLNYQRVLDTALDLSAAAMTRSSPAADPIVNAVLLFAQKEMRGMQRIKVKSLHGTQRKVLRIAALGLAASELAGLPLGQRAASPPSRTGAARAGGAALAGPGARFCACA